MSEKVLREFKVIETDDGFRIEMTGDKEALRQMLPFLTPFADHEPHPSREAFGRKLHERRHHLRNRAFGHRAFGHDQHGHGLFEHDPFERLHQAHALHRMMDDFGYDLGPWWDETAAPPASASAADETPDQPNA